MSFSDPLIACIVPEAGMEAFNTTSSLIITQSQTDIDEPRLKVGFEYPNTALRQEL